MRSADPVFQATMPNENVSILASQALSPRVLQTFSEQTNTNQVENEASESRDLLS
jgi:hypothetical protein